jgi:kynurenine formamidase
MGLWLWLVVLASCAPAAPQAPAAVPTWRTVDLSHVVRVDVPYWPEEPLTELDRDDGGGLRSVRIGTRTGTLLALVADPAATLTVDTLSPRDLIVPAVVIDRRDVAQDTPGYTLTIAELEAWEAQHGQIPAAALVLIVTGWDVRWGDAAAYMALDATGRSQAPTLSNAAADWLQRERAIAGVGIDGPQATLPLHEMPQLVLLNLTNLEQLPATGTTLMIGALRLQAAERSPARVLALLPEP